MKHYFLLLFAAFLFSSCKHIEDSAKNLNANDEIEIYNLKTFINPAKFRQKRKMILTTRDLNSLGLLSMKNLFQFSSALMNDLEARKHKKSLKVLEKNIEAASKLAFKTKNNLHKKYEWFEKNLDIYGYFLIKEQFFNKKGQLCKKFLYSMSLKAGQESIYQGFTCRMFKKNIEIWNIEYEVDKKS